MKRTKTPAAEASSQPELEMQRVEVGQASRAVDDARNRLHRAQRRLDELEHRQAKWAEAEEALRRNPVIPHRRPVLYFAEPPTAEEVEETRSVIAERADALAKAEAALEAEVSRGTTWHPLPAAKEAGAPFLAMKRLTLGDQTYEPGQPVSDVSALSYHKLEQLIATQFLIEVR